MTRLTTFSLTMFASLFVFGVGSNASADVWHHLDEQAVLISKKTRALTSEVRHYRHTPEYVHLIHDTRDLSRLAAKVHQIAHNHGCIVQLASHVRKLDSVFHHTEDLFDRIESEAAHGHGHVHGNTRHVRELLDCIEDSIHHLQEDLASLQAVRHVTRSVYRSGYYTPTREVVHPSHYRSQRSYGHSKHKHKVKHGRGHGHSYGHGPRIQGRNFGIDSDGITIGRGSAHFRISF